MHRSYMLWSFSTYPLPGFLFNHAQDGRELLNMRPCPKPVPWSPSPDTLPISCQPTLDHASEDLCCRSLMPPDRTPHLSIPEHSISGLLVFYLSLFPSFSYLARSLLDSGNLESVLTVPFVCPLLPLPNPHERVLSSPRYGHHISRCPLPHVTNVYCLENFSVQDL